MLMQLIQPYAVVSDGNVHFHGRGEILDIEDFEALRLFRIGIARQTSAEAAQGPPKVVAGMALRVRTLDRIGGNAPAWSILICSLDCRAHLLHRLLDCLKPQLTDDVEIVVATDNGELSIGDKRNDLLAAARGEYVCFIDDDDLVSADYVARILDALEARPDAVGFWARRTVDGVFDFKAKHSHDVEQYGTVIVDQNTIHLRCINHLNPVKADLARRTAFYPKNSGEDTDYAYRLRPLIKSQVFVDEILYLYEYRTKATRTDERTNERVKQEAA